MSSAPDPEPLDGLGSSISMVSSLTSQAVRSLPSLSVYLWDVMRPSRYTLEPLWRYWLHVSARRSQATILNQVVSSLRSPLCLSLNRRLTARENLVTAEPLGV